MVEGTQTLDPASADRVRKLVKKGKFVGYAAREWHQVGLDGAMSAIQRRVPILFPLHADLRYLGRVQEQLLPRRAGLDFALRHSRIVLHQHDSRRGRHDPATRARRELSLLERSAREAPREPFHRYNLGVALRHLGLHGEAEEALRLAIKRAPADAIWAPDAYVTLSKAVGGQGRSAEAVTICEDATRLAPKWPGAWCALGAALIDDGRLEPALRAYTVALQSSEKMWRQSDAPDDTRWQIRTALGRIHLKRNEYERAAECLADGIALNSDNAELHLLIARAYEELGRPTDVGRHLDRATASPHGGAAAFVAAGDFFTKKAEDALLRGVIENPESRMLLERIERLRVARVSR
jgi:tetratricopeptide (TPR) repeat protein